LNIREARETDLPLVLQVQRAAFGGETEAGLVRDMLADPTAQPLLSLLAVEAEGALGHVLFSRARIDGSGNEVRLAILAPLAVIPEAQGKGIGRQLVEAGLERLTAKGVALVLVLGDPAYYRRFGFTPAEALGLLPPYPLAEEHAEAWMARRLGNGYLAPTGTVRCCDTLMRPGLWQA
jgi:putative acetyltransferase